MNKIVSVFLVLLVLACNTRQEIKTFEANWESLKQHKTPEWFMDAKFGIYFHWGVYSYMGKGEWYSHHMYEDKNEGWNHWLREYHIETYGDTTEYYHFVPKFTARFFDAEDWARLFKKSGAQFAGPVAEHCDYFSNWDSKVNKYNAVNYGPKRDLVGELEKAIKKEGLKFTTTFHHSWEWGWYNLWNGLADTTNKEFRDMFGEKTLPETFYRLGHDASGNFTGEVHPDDVPSRKFVDQWKAKIFEVVDKYQPDLLWFDSRLFLIPEEDRKEMIAHYYNKEFEWEKEVVLTYKNKDLPKGVGVIDMERGRMNEKTDYPWLTDDSYAWNSWSWRAEMDLKTPDIIIDELVDITSKNGCLILNITPSSDGIIPTEMRKGLLEIGEWLEVYGEAIYKTRPFITYGEGVTELNANHFGGVEGRGIQYTDNDFRFTKNGNVLYIIQLAPPVEGKTYLLKSFAQNGKAGTYSLSNLELLGSNAEVNWTQNNEGVKIKANTLPANDKAVVYKATIKK